jgi:hypothetical protein
MTSTISRASLFILWKSQAGAFPVCKGRWAVPVFIYLVSGQASQGNHPFSSRSFAFGKTPDLLAG